MEQESDFKPKMLSLTYQEYQEKGKSIQSMIIDHYVVYDLIGMGSYGSVYRGMDDNTKKKVAIKVIDMKMIKNDQNPQLKAIKLRLAESEPKLMYMCDSPYLIKCYDVYENEDLKILIMEFCNGKTLQAEIDEKRRIPQREAWTILKHIMNGLMVLHSHKIVHRDLKAENIMSHNGTYKIIDFGFSKKLQIAQQSAQVRNTSLGTITTMAPEVMGRKPYGLKADIWSVGIIFFQMIYGKYPYDSTTAPRMYQQIQTKKLFHSSEPFKYNGYTPSKQAYQFLKFILVIESDKRPDWRAVTEYPNIKNLANQEISQRFIPQCDVVIDKDLDYRQALEQERPSIQFRATATRKVEEKKKVSNEPVKRKQTEQKIEQKKQQKKQQKKEQKKQEKKQQVKLQKEIDSPKKKKFDLKQNIRLEKQEKQRKERQKQEKIQRKPAIRSLNREQIRQKQKQINKEEDQEYNWTKQAHLQCLKTSFIFRQIVYPLEVANPNNLHDRKFIEFFYLLSARSFNNMSPIRDEIDERKRLGKSIQKLDNLNQQVKQLYKQVHKHFIDFSKALTKKQNQKTSMLKDWFSKKLSSDKFKMKDRYLTGVQKLQYSKEEQIIYTTEYYNSNIKEDIKKQSKIIIRMENYMQIMCVTLNDLNKKGLTFQEFLDKTLKI